MLRHGRAVADSYVIVLFFSGIPIFAELPTRSIRYCISAYLCDLNWLYTGLPPIDHPPFSSFPLSSFLSLLRKRCFYQPCPMFVRGYLRSLTARSSRELKEHRISSTCPGTTRLLAPSPHVSSLFGNRLFPHYFHNSPTIIHPIWPHQPRFKVDLPPILSSGSPVAPFPFVSSLLCFKHFL